jgi:hypothetical protein
LRSRKASAPDQRKHGRALYLGLTGPSIWKAATTKEGHTMTLFSFLMIIFAGLFLFIIAYKYKHPQQPQEQTLLEEMKEEAIAAEARRRRPRFNWLLFNVFILIPGAILFFALHDAPHSPSDPRALPPLTEERAEKTAESPPLADQRVDKLDELFAKRDAMVGAVAMMMFLPPNCLVDHKTPTPEMFYRFVVSYGHKPDDAFMAEVQSQAKKLADNEPYNKLSDKDKKAAAEMTCAFGILYSGKLKDRIKNIPVTPGY